MSHTEDAYEVSEKPRHGLEHHGIRNVGRVYWTPRTPTLYEQVIRRREGLLAHLGPIVVRGGHHMGRSPNDKFIVREPTSEHEIWWGPVNRPFTEEQYQALYHRLLAYVQGLDLFVQDCYVGADPEYRIPVRVVTETAWQSLFARNMFIQVKDRTTLVDHEPQFRLLCFPHFHAVPQVDGTDSEVVIVVHFGERTILIGGSSYGGEIKKSVFTALNYIMPRRGVLSMHCSANVGPDGDVALFFGLSGTGKTSLSADRERSLIGDDEHGWSDKGIFNFEGGCYAKVIRLSREAEPDIYECTRKFGTILENVAIGQESRRLDLDSDDLTENTRACYPLTHIPNFTRGGMADHPQDIVLLTCDAFGVMPPVAKLTTEQAMYHFLSGYTAKVAGTDKEVEGVEATFSACFGAPFMPLNPTVYTEMLGERIRRHNVNCWMVNTGWMGGPYGVGERISIADTRAILRAAISGELDDVPMRQEEVFGFAVPESCPGVSPDLLNPQGTWLDQAGYEVQRRKLAEDFIENFEQFRAAAPEGVETGGPRLNR